MKKQKLSFPRISRFSVALIFLFAVIAQFIPINNVSAAQITSRSLTLTANGAVGGSTPGGVVHHAFAFTLPTAGNVGSIKFEYCTTAADSIVTPTCVTPTGLSTPTSVTLSSQTGATGFTVNATTLATNGAPYLTRTSASISASTAVTYQLDGITNPIAVNGETFFVRISTYASTDTTGSLIDSGTVAAATNRGIDLTGTMPESLVFCTGATVGLTSSVPDCSTVTTGAVAFNQLFSPTDTATATSQMAASTNALSGYAITVNGPTLTSGSPTIPAMGTTTTSIKGTGQFGLNLKLNTVASSAIAVGAELTVASNGTNYRGQAVGTAQSFARDYNVVDSFSFVSGDTVANSGNATLGGSDAQIYTVSYIVNVPGSQPAGTYTTTLTYICTPTF